MKNAARFAQNDNLSVSVTKAGQEGNDKNVV